MKNKDTFNYKGWLNSDNFIKRSFAVLGYNFMGTIFLYIILMIFILLLVLFSGLISLIFI